MPQHNTQLQPLTNDELVAISGGGPTYEWGYSIGHAVSESLVGFFEIFTDAYYGV